MQCRVNDVFINETPKFLDLSPTDKTHAIAVIDPDNLAQTLTLRLALRGVISLLNVRTPSIDDWNRGDIRRLALTSKDLLWDPSSTLYEEQEAAMVGYDGHTYDRSTLRGRPNTLVINSLVSTSELAADVSSDDNFYCVLSSYVMISGVDTNSTGPLMTKVNPPIDFRTLAARWMISPQQAQDTISVTTQRGVRECLNPNIARRFLTNDRMLRYRRLPHPIFLDTMFSKTAAVGGNKCAQVYTTFLAGVVPSQCNGKGKPMNAFCYSFSVTACRPR